MSLLPGNIPRKPQPPTATADDLAAAISPITDPAQAARVEIETPGVSLTTRVTGAFLYSLANTLGAKAINLGLQLALAWLLDRQAFGLIALAYTVTTFIGLLQQIGLRDVLIHRQRHFHRWANAAFWLSMASGIAAAFLTCAVAPLAARLYHRPELVKLLFLLAAMIPIANLSVVPAARLSAQMRFGLLCGFNLFSTALVAGLSIFFAYRGFGAYSFVLPRLIESGVRAIFCWTAAPIALQSGPQFRRWRFLLGDSLLVLGANAAFLLTSQGDNILLGLHADGAAVGIYYFAFNLSIQGTMLLVVNLFEVLLPSLASMDRDPVRQTSALLRAMRAMCLVSVPICLLQTATAEPLIHLLFGPRWYPAIPIVQVLAIGMSFHVLSWPTHGLVTAQGRFRANFFMALWMGALFVAVVYLSLTTKLTISLGGKWNDPGFRTAVGVSVAYAIMHPIYLYIAIRPAGLGAHAIIKTCAGPYIAAGWAALVGVVASRLLPASLNREWYRLTVIVIAGGATYSGIVWFLMPDSRKIIRLLGELSRRSTVPRE
ncbi:MAG TPA: oligosaccharide flippase family protein [Tepidisphaeraceae bacterium]|jgi:PST family polysaccharide transporter|nr:oligosaccharide flippase family protein [Tepidisphaeraceae bacterium]